MLIMIRKSLRNLLYRPLVFNMSSDFSGFSINCDVQEKFSFSVINATILKPLNEQGWFTIDEIEGNFT